MRWTRHSPDTEGDRERARLTAALVSLCAEQGYRQTTLAEVLDRAGVDAATFDRYFASLEDCFCVVYQELSSQFLARAGAAFAANETWRDQIRAVAYAMLDFLREDPDRADFLFVEVLSAGTRAQLIRDQNMEALYAFIALGRQEAEDPDSIPRERAATVGGGLHSRIRMQLAVAGDDPQSWERLVPELMYSVVEPYLGTEVALEELTMPRPSPVLSR